VTDPLFLIYRSRAATDRQGRVGALLTDGEVPRVAAGLTVLFAEWDAEGPPVEGAVTVSPDRTP
jgi:hypothetical protein